MCTPSDSGMVFFRMMVLSVALIAVAAVPCLAAMGEGSILSEPATPVISSGGFRPASRLSSFGFGLYARFWFRVSTRFSSVVFRVLGFMHDHGLGFRPTSRSSEKDCCSQAMSQNSKLETMKAVN